MAMECLKQLLQNFSSFHIEIRGSYNGKNKQASEGLAEDLIRSMVQTAL